MKYLRTTAALAGAARLTGAVALATASLAAVCGPALAIDPATLEWSNWFGNDKGFDADGRRHVADVDGDGLPDVLAYWNDGVVVGRNTGAALAPPELWGKDYAWVDGKQAPPLLYGVADIDGDGKGDTVAFEPFGVRAARSSGFEIESVAMKSFDFGTEPEAGGWYLGEHQRELTDVDGDGKVDLVGIREDGVWVALGETSGFRPAKRWLRAFCAEVGWKWSQPRMFADVDGDGLPDLVGFSSLGVMVSLSEGMRFAPPRLWVRAFGDSSAAGGWNASQHHRTLADVDGDGRADVVGFGTSGVYVSLSRGLGFAEPELWLGDLGYTQAGFLDVSPRLVGDVDGDGRADVVALTEAGTYVAKSTGVSFGGVQLVADWFGPGAKAGEWTAEHPRLLADMDGNGTKDLVGFHNDGVYVLKFPKAPLIAGWGTSQVKTCYTPMNLMTAGTADGTAELDALEAQAQAQVASCAQLCEDTQSQIAAKGLCDDPEFFQSPCGVLERERMNTANAIPGTPANCSGAVGSYVTGDEWQDGATVGAALKPATETGGGAVPEGVEEGVVKLDYDWSDHGFSGLSTQYYGVRMTDHTRRTANDTTHTVLYTLQRAAMSSDGPRVKSCRELVYEKYYDISLWFDATNRLGDDHWAMFRLAYNLVPPDAPSGDGWRAGSMAKLESQGQILLGPPTPPKQAIGARALLGLGPDDKEGAPLPPLFTGATENKNAYFDTPVEPDPVQRQALLAIAASPSAQDNPLSVCMSPTLLDVTPETCPWLHLPLQSEALYDVVREGRADHTYEESWEWHQAKGLALMDLYIEEELDRMQSRQERYLHLLHRRSVLVGELWESLVAISADQQEKLAGWVAPESLAATPPNWDDVVDPASSLLATQQLQKQSWLADSLLDGAIAGLESGGLAKAGGPGDLAPSLVDTDLGVTTPGAAVTLKKSGLAFPILPDLLANLSLYDRIELVNAAIEAELEAAATEGCLDLTTDNKCDWSPKLFVQRIQDHFTQKGEMDYRRCLDEQPVDLGDMEDSGVTLQSGGVYPLIAVWNGSSHQIVTCNAQAVAGVDPLLDGYATPTHPGDWAASSRLLEYFPRCFKAFQGLVIQQLAEALGGLDNVFEPGSETDITLAQSDSESTKLGNKDFGVELGYSFGWKLPTFESETNCSVDPSVHGSAYVDGRIFGRKVSIFEAGAKAGVFDIPSSAGAQRTFEADAWVEILGIDFIDTSSLPFQEPLTQLEWHVIASGQPGKYWDKTLVSAVVMIGPVPLSLKAGITGGIGLGWAVAGGIPQGADCAEGALAVRGQLTPFAALGVFASASIDALIVEAGILAELTLVSLMLPFTVQMELEAGTPAPGVQDSSFLELSASLDLKVTFLSGSLKAFLEFCYIFDCERVEATLFKWNGPSHTLNLFQAASKIELGPVRMLQSALSGL
jgi:hypothetical protein